MQNASSLHRQVCWAGGSKRGRKSGSLWALLPGDAVTGVLGLKRGCVCLELTLAGVVIDVFLSFH